MRFAVIALWAAACGTTSGTTLDAGDDAGPHDGGAVAVCGNASVEDGEACDDGNDTAFDGCEPDCTYTCNDDSQCADDNTCNGAETCGAEHRCVAASPVAEGTLCTDGSIEDGLCRGERCVLRSCANGSLDPGEACDDGNVVSGDGCEPDCTRTCVDPPPESCNGEDDDCDGEIDEEVSTECWPDGDFDGYAADDAVPIRHCGLCPSAHTSRAPADAASIDCDDVQAGRHPGLIDICDGVDADCSAPEAADPSEDADGDAHAPPDAPCAGGFPKDDCYDANPAVHPGQRDYFPMERGDGSFDYDCNGSNEMRWVGQSVCNSTCSGVPINDGWCSAASPGCGAGGTWTTNCMLYRTSCGRMCMPRTQECR